ncbi:MAG: HAD hydrolase-like protein [Vicinamibacterales bacterium]
MQILFDLDGTLADSRDGITACLLHALADAGVPAPPLEELSSCIGPPLATSFATLLGTNDPARIERAIALYRQRYEEEGVLQHVLYPGVLDMLSALRGDGHWLGIVTAKPRVYATRIVEHLGIDSLVTHVLGPDLSARRYTKETLIRSACAEWKISPGAVVFGDRADDVSGAKANGLQAVGVTWGYGSFDELRAAEPDRLADHPAEVVDIVRLVCEVKELR